jgi:tricarballylate dehydrogenase
MAGEIYDVIVVGAGNAGLTAALAARHGKRACCFWTNVPNRHAGATRDFRRRLSLHVQQSGRHASNAPDVTDEEAAKMDVGTYTNAEFFEDVMQVTEYAADKKLTNILVDQSYPTARWLTEMNVK